MIRKPKEPFLTKRWVYRLSDLGLDPFKFPDEDGKNYDRDTPTVGNLTTPNIIVSEEMVGRDGRRYALFENYVQVFRFCESIRKEGKIPHLYEISPYYMKLHFDIDLKKEESGDGILDDSIFEGTNRHFYILRPCLQSIDRVFARLFPNHYDPERIIEDILVFEAHRDDKISFHVIIDGYYLSCQETHAFYREVVNDMVQGGYVSQSTALDFSVYKKNQSFRMFGSNKATLSGRSGVKQLYAGPPVEIGPGRCFSRESMIASCFKNEIKVDERLRNLRLLERSLLSNTLGNVRLSMPSSVNKSVKGRPPLNANLEESTMTEEEMVKMEEVFFRHYSSKTDKGERAFQFMKFVPRGGYVCLKRIKPSTCPVCEKQHEAENAFLYCTPEGNVNFVCRRAQESRKGRSSMYVGMLTTT
jgi:hypothetical protein